MVRKYSEIYLEARKQLRETEGENASWTARLLLAEAAGIPVEKLLADLDHYASEQTDLRMQELTARTLQGEPLAYVLGRWSFYGLDLAVNPGVLIPRDDTMAVTDLAVEALSQMPEVRRALDLCTGSGCIGLALASRFPTVRFTLADLSDDALRTARSNILNLHLGKQAAAVKADVTEPAPTFLGQFDLIVSNPPYVTAAEMSQLQSSVRDYEPQMALYGGEDGLDFYRAIVHNYAPLLLPGGALCLEFGMGQEDAVCAILEAGGFRDPELRRDARDVVRAVRIYKNFETNV